MKNPQGYIMKASEVPQPEFDIYSLDYTFMERKRMTFEQCREFIRQEKLMMKSAIEIYNATNGRM